MNNFFDEFYFESFHSILESMRTLIISLRLIKTKMEMGQQMFFTKFPFVLVFQLYNLIYFYLQALKWKNLSFKIWNFKCWKAFNEMAI